MRTILRPSTGSWLDGKLLCNWVERASFELYRLLADQ
jgi:hypothetical protein